MGQSLEAIIVIPIVIFLTVVIIMSTTNLYENIYTISSAEKTSIKEMFNNDSIWHKDSQVHDFEYKSTYTSVNPVKLKQLTDFIIDTTKEVSGNIPLVNDAYGLIHE